MVFASSKYSIHVNGVQSNTIDNKRWLKQGDPLSPMLLSPMLFILAVHVLEKMLKLGNKHDHLSDLNFRGMLSEIRSIQFAGGTLIFCKANRVDITNLKNSLLSF